MIAYLGLIKPQLLFLTMLIRSGYICANTQAAVSKGSTSTCLLLGTGTCIDTSETCWMLISDGEKCHNNISSHKTIT